MFLKRGQVSFEYLVIFAVAAIMIIPLMLIFAHQSSSIEADIAYAQAQSALSKISASAEEIYFQGPPARKTLRVKFPEGLTEVRVEESAIVFKLSTSDGVFELFEDTSAKLSGDIDSFGGVHVLVFEALEDSVLITDK